MGEKAQYSGRVRAAVVVFIYISCLAASTVLLKAAYGLRMDRFGSGEHHLVLTFYNLSLLFTLSTCMCVIVARPLTGRRGYAVIISIVLLILCSLLFLTVPPAAVTVELATIRDLRSSYIAVGKLPGSLVNARVVLSSYIISLAQAANLLIHYVEAQQELRK